MSSSIGSTFSSGVQDVSAILPLMGTDQCESHITSGLRRGFLYPAATTLSIFGSLGAAKAGIMISVAASRFRLDTRWLSFEINGAEILKNTGFGAAKEDGLSSILLDKSGTLYGVEDQLQKLGINFEDLDQHKVNALSDTYTWNVWLASSAAFLSILGVVPYIHLNLRGDSDHSPLLKWFFPASRVFGSFLVAVAGQLVMQHRILSIVRRKLIVEAKLKPAAKIPNLSKRLKDALDSPDKHTDKYLQDVLECLKSEPPQIAKEWPILSYHGLMSALFHAEERPLTTVLFWGVFLFYLPWILVLLGSCLIVAGYVGCFSIVQGTSTPSAPLIWLGLEISLSIIRMFLWASNPASDEKTGIDFSLDTIKYRLLPTCTDYAEHLEEDKNFPLTKQDDFFELHLIPYLGSTVASKIQRPQDDRYTLFYTFTRRSRSEPLHQLYITVSFTDDDGNDSAVIIHKHEFLRHSTSVFREGQLDDDSRATGGEILDRADKRIRHIHFLSEVEQHYQSILDALRKREESLIEMRRPWVLSWNMNRFSISNYTDDMGDDVEELKENAEEKSTLVQSLSMSAGERDVEKGVVIFDSPENSPLRETSTKQPEVDSAEEAYLAFGKIQRDRQQDVARISKWLDHYLELLGRASTDNSSNGFLSKDSGINIVETEKPFLDWLEGLEACFAEEWASVERSLLREYNETLKRVLDAVKNPALRTQLKRQMNENRKAESKDRLKQAKERRKALATKVTNDAKKGAPSHAIRKIDEAEVVRRIDDVWERTIRETDRIDLDSTAYQRVRQVLNLDNERLGGPEDMLLGHRLVKFLNASKKWERIILPPRMAFTASTDFKSYIVNSQTVQFVPDLVLRRNSDLEGLFFDLDLESDAAADDVLRSCIQVAQSLKRLTSVGFGKRGLQGVTTATFDAFKSLIERNSSIRSVWFPEQAAASEGDLQVVHEERRWVGRDLGLPKKDSLIVFVTFRAAEIAFEPESVRRASIGGSASSFQIEFQAPPRRVFANGQVVLRLTMSQFEQFSKAELSIRLDNNQAAEDHPVEISVNGRWKTMSFPIDGVRPDERNKVFVTVKRAWVADVRLDGLEARSLDEDISRIKDGIKGDMKSFGEDVKMLGRGISRYRPSHP